MPKIKNIIIFLAIGAVLVLIYIFFLKPKPPVAALVSSEGTSPAAQNAVGGDTSDKLAQDFLNLLLNVKNIKLDISILSDPAFISLHDSSITLTPDGTEGRVNPFAAFGSDAVATVPPISSVPSVPPAHLVPPVPPTCILPKILDLVTNTCVNSTPN